MLCLLLSTQAKNGIDNTMPFQRKHVLLMAACCRILYHGKQCGRRSCSVCDMRYSAHIPDMLSNYKKEVLLKETIKKECVDISTHSFGIL